MKHQVSLRKAARATKISKKKLETAIKNKKRNVTGGSPGRPKTLGEKEEGELAAWISSRALINKYPTFNEIKSMALSLWQHSTALKGPVQPPAFSQSWKQGFMERHEVKEMVPRQVTPVSICFFLPCCLFSGSPLLPLPGKDDRSQSDRRMDV
eukprot:TRINITY_DN438_c0_g1_i1.p3 TRINITY_DN438_c0_g1~~TRINITY_DN438_c0_g1_i1.p3  ORF type:complete len:153 (+),score=31.62 TRINITY_DN438_c0_g1_i1:230-688(+)